MKAVHVLMTLVLLSLFISGCIESPSENNTWYVDIQGTRDFISIQTAVEAAANGDTISVTAGEYHESIVIGKSLNIEASEDVVIIRNNGTQVLITINSDDVSISGFSIKNGSYGIVVNGNNSTITSNYFINNSVGIEVSDGTKNHLIYNNYFENSVNIFGSGMCVLNIEKKGGKNILGKSYLGGNYWNDYSGYDIDYDGIGDTQLPYRGGLELDGGGDMYPLTDRVLQSSVYVDDDFTPDVEAWGISYFASLQLAVEAVQTDGIIQIAPGNYEGPLVLNKSMILLGEDKENTVITSSDGLGYGQPLIRILQPNCIIRNLSVDSESSVAGRVGIDVESKNNLIEEIMINGFEYGIRILYAKGINTVNSVSVINCTTGIYSSYTRENLIENCVIQNSSLYGIFLNAGSDDNVIEGNSIYDCTYGMRIKGSTLNFIINNTIANNDRGMYFCCGARNNTVTQNRFRNNEEWHASDQYGNIWNKDNIGNYWDDYLGSDTNGDGIGEDPYVISEGYSSDEYPIIVLSFFEK